MVGVCIVRFRVLSCKKGILEVILNSIYSFLRKIKLNEIVNLFKFNLKICFILGRFCFWCIVGGCGEGVW